MALLACDVSEKVDIANANGEERLRYNIYHYADFISK